MSNPPEAQSQTPLGRLIEASERPVLGLAMAAVALYLAELQGLWHRLDVEGPYHAVALGIDVVFLIDLVLKSAVQRGRYWRSPWFLIDFFSTLPILGAVHFLPFQLEGLRFVRTFRLFRVLRTLRALRVLKSLSVFTESGGPQSELELAAHRKVEHAISASVIAYVVFFLLVLGGAGHDDAAEFWLVLGSVAGMTVMMVVVRFQLPAISTTQVRSLLNVALPHQVAEHFLANPDSYDRTSRAPATVVFTDIQGFTSTVEALGTDLEAIKHNLEAALDVIVESHLKHDLIVDKFIGDAVMSFRGGPHADGDPADNALRVVLASVEGARALQALGNPYFSNAKTGGASAEHALIGTFGTRRRLSYTVLGDRVNLAARLEGACNGFGVTNLFCDLTYSLTKHSNRVVWRRVGAIRVQGKEEVQQVYEAFLPSDTLDWVSTYHQAVEAYESQDFAGAAEHFRAVIDARGSDGPSNLYLGLCTKFTAQLPADWEPIIATKK